MANREFKTITERKLVCKALRTPSNARWSQRRFLLAAARPGATEVPCTMLMAEEAAEASPRTGSPTGAALGQIHAEVTRQGIREGESQLDPFCPGGQASAAVLEAHQPRLPHSFLL